MTPDPIFLAPVAGATAILTVFGLHRGWLAWPWARLPAPVRPSSPMRWPTVTVQLPVFDERNVVERLVAAAGRIRYPRDCLVIQVLDDSRDDTTRLAAESVDALRSAGVNAVLLHRDDRTGFKAGALAAGLAASDSELVAVFDADFVPSPDFLEVAVPWFTDPRVGMVQGRWGHLNADESWLTAAQAVLLDGHFAIEHAARHRAGRWFNFNGTAGVWRRRAIDDARGWSHDTLTEDLDLSNRAQLTGWRFVYDHDLVVPAELPATLSAFKAQQHRWAKGGVQTARKLLGRIWRAPVPLGTRAEATFHLCANAAYPLIFGLAVALPLAVLGPRGDAQWVGLGLLVAGTFPVFGFYAAAVRATDARPSRSLAIAAAVALGAGMSLNQTRAVLEGLGGAVGVFVRTPKRGDARASGYVVGEHGVWALEWALAAWLLCGSVVAACASVWSGVPHGALFAAGFLAVAGESTRERRRGEAPSSRAGWPAAPGRAGSAR